MKIESESTRRAGNDSGGSSYGDVLRVWWLAPFSRVCCVVGGRFLSILNQI